MTMRIATFTDHIHTPSSRFRVRQYFPSLEANGVSVNDYYRKLSTEVAAVKTRNRRIRHSMPLLAKAVVYEFGNIWNRFIETINSNKYDAVWLSRQLIIGYPSFELLIRKPVVYDIDDAIFLCGPAAKLQFKLTASKASIVVAGNDFLAEFAAKYNKDVVIVPTAVDTNRWTPAEGEGFNQDYRSRSFKVGWSGTSSSFSYFTPIQQELEHFFRNFPLARLAIMSDRFPHQFASLEPYIDFVKWSPIDEVSFVQSLDVGLMPIGHEPWSRGKCAYKMLLYAACGIPVVVTPIGMNLKILSEAEVGIGAKQKGEWYEALRLLYLDEHLRKRFGENGVALVDRHYSITKHAPMILEILRGCQ